MLKHPNNQDGLFKCSYCPKTFKQKESCDTHERLHTVERPFECQVCGMKFKARSTLYNHRVTHLESKSTSAIIVKKTMQL